MFSEKAFVIDPESIENPAKRGKIQRIAADTLRAAGVEFREDDRPPFDILAAMPDIDEGGEARVKILAVMVGLGDVAV